MTREFGLVSTSIWNSRKFSGLTSDDARLLYFYLLTCPSVNSLGCYVLKPGYAAADLGWDAIRYQHGIDALCAAALIGVDTTENLIRVIGFLQHSEIMNVKHGIGAVRLALTLPDCDQKLCLLKDLAEQKHIDRSAVEAEIRRISGTVSIPYREGIDKPEPKPEPKPIEQQPRAEVPSSQADQTNRERLLAAMGADPRSGHIGPNGRRLGTLADTEEAEKWSAMGLTIEKQCAVIAERCAAMRKSNPHWTPGRFAYFTGAMADLIAARNAKPALPGQASSPSRADQLRRYQKIAGGNA